MKQKKIVLVAGLAIGLVAGFGYAAATPSVAGGGYLFAHTRTGRDYGHLYFDVSRDGLTWTQFNGGREIPLAPSYLGHPYITEDDHGESRVSCRAGRDESCRERAVERTRRRRHSHSWIAFPIRLQVIVAFPKICA